VIPSCNRQFVKKSVKKPAFYFLAFLPLQKLLAVVVVVVEVVEVVVVVVFIYIYIYYLFTVVFIY
jgi:hypothetical protein